MKKNTLIENLSLVFFGIGYFIVNLLTLSSFPYTHSDEPWLAGLSKAYLDHKSIFTTEPFFDIFPRQAHAIKSLFHLLQSIFIKLLGYNLTSVRLLSLLVALTSLSIILLISKKLLKSSAFSLLTTMLLAFNVQFIYAAHFARQEILLFLVLVLAYYFYSSTHLTLTKKVIISACIIGLSIGIHPNAFIIALMFGLVLVYDWLFYNINIKQILIYIGILSGFALIFIGISLIGNSNFFSDYWTYGATLSVDADSLGRFTNFKNFYIKLDQQISGTYYLPNISPYFIAGIALSIVSLIILILKTIRTPFTQKSKKNKAHSPKFLGHGLFMMVAFNIGIFIIGRMNPTSIVFLLFPAYIMVIGIISIAITKEKLILSSLIVLILLTTSHSYTEIQPIIQLNQNAYQVYESTLKNALPENPVVLGNLSSGFIFEDIEFYDIRNLFYLDNMSLETYILENKINTIVYYESYDYIHRNSQWQILYGDDSLYYDDLNLLINEYGSLVYEFESSLYGNRIIRYINDHPWHIKIYYIDMESMY